MLYLVKSAKITAMRTRVSQKIYETAFYAKVKLARIGEGIAASDMANYLGITLDKYYRYESRHMMRHDLIPLFCSLTKIDIHKLMSSPITKKKSASIETD